MTPLVYNIAIAVGILLTATGVGLWSLPAGLATAGVLVLAFTVYAAERLGQGGG